MTYVVTDACIGCRYGDCVSVCPQAAFHEGPNFVVINPRNCANCGLCEMVCPVSAIVAKQDLGEDRAWCIELNAELSAQWPVARETTPVANADENSFLVGKRHLLQLP